MIFFCYNNYIFEYTFTQLSEYVVDKYFIINGAIILPSGNYWLDCYVKAL